MAPRNMVIQTVLSDIGLWALGTKKLGVIMETYMARQTNPLIEAFVTYRTFIAVRGNMVLMNVFTQT